MNERRRNFWLEYTGKGDEHGFDARVHYKCPLGPNTPVREVLPGDDPDAIRKDFDQKFQARFDELQQQHAALLAAAKAVSLDVAKGVLVSHRDGDPYMNVRNLRDAIAVCKGGGDE